MNISIKHINNTFNYGSCMMAITLINCINRELENVKIFLDTSTKEDINRIKLETNATNLYFDGYQQQSNLYDKVTTKIKRLILEKYIDVIIIIGGDDISEYYGIEALEKELNKLKDLSINKKVILLGQTMGPFTEKRGKLAKDSLKNTKIYTRDDKCFDYLKELNFNNLIKGRDLAFLELPHQLKSKHILKKYNLIENDYFTIVPSGLTNCYTTNYNKYINEQIEIIKKLLNNTRLINKNIVLLPHVLLPKHVDDRLVIRDIIKQIDEKYKSRIIAIDDALLPSEAREILANGIFTITGRMHAAVSTFYMRKPAISLSYSVKYAGVIGDGLDMNELVIESANDSLWNEGKISESVNEKVDFVLNNYEDLIHKIDINVSKTSKIVQEQLNDLIKELKK